MNRISAISIFAIFCCSCCADEPACNPSQDIQLSGDFNQEWNAKRAQILAEMAAIIEPSIRRKDTKYPIFHGCFDWHSAVHGHWALLRIARTTGNHDAQASMVVEAFDAAGIAAEAAFLKTHPQFEMPYGRAWLLRLVIEYETWCETQKLVEDSDRLSTLGDQVAESLIRYYADGRTPSIASREYQNDAWALAQMFAYFKHRRQATQLDFLQKLVQQYFLVPQTDVRFAADAERANFFSTFGNLAYLVAVTQVQEVTDAFVRRSGITDSDLLPVNPLLPSAHHYGINWSRAWSLRALSQTTSIATEQRRFTDAYYRHVQVGMQHHRQGVGDFAQYDHWVPQFAVYALTENAANENAAMAPDPLRSRPD